MTEIKLTRIVEASPETVFRAWLDAEMLSRFMIPADGVVIDEATVDARVGGKYMIKMNVGDKVLPHHGEYTVIDEYTELAFTWISPMAGDSSIVTLSFAPATGGFTALTLHHTGLPSDEAVAAHTGGWNHILDLCTERLQMQL